MIKTVGELLLELKGLHPDTKIEVNLITEGRNTHILVAEITEIELSEDMETLVIKA